MPGEDFGVVLTADVSDLTSGMEEARASGEETAESLKGAFEGAGEGIKEIGEKANEAGESIATLSKGLSGLAEIAGLGVIAEGLHKIEETIVEASTEMEMFAARTQTSLSEAKDYVASMETMGIQTSAMSMAMRKLSSDMATGGKNIDKVMGSGYAAASSQKSLGEVFDEVSDKLATYGNNAKEAGAANTLLGRSGSLLVATHQEQKAVAEELAKAYEAMGGDTQKLAEEGNQLRLIQGIMNEAWQAFAQAIAPAVVAGLKTIAGAMMEMEGIVMELYDDVRMLIEALQTLASVAGSVLSAVMADVQSVGSAIGKVMSGDFSGAGAALQTDNLSKALDAGKTKIQELGDEWNKVDQAQQDRQVKIQDEVKHLWDGTIEHVSKQWADKMGQGAVGTGADVPDFGKGGGKGKKKGGGADPMDALDNQLDQADAKMDKMAAQFQKLGSEAQMASKVSSESFAQLSAQAQADYAIMQAKYKEFTADVEAGSKDAAKQAEEAWKLSAQKFEEDWKAAATKAKADMQQFKSAADQMASEVSGILNQAISGKVNWAQEFQKILSQMLDHLIKHLFQQVAMWAMNVAQVNAIKAAGAATGLAEQKAANTVAGTSDAVTAAKGAYASASQVPYIGWILGPLAAAAAFAGVEAFGSAEGGFDVPPGVAPITQLHPNEMVLPAQHADTIRRLGDAMGGGGGGGSDTHNWNIQSLDPSSLVDIVNRNPDVFTRAVATSKRSGMRMNIG
jgi:hypothetical protein